MPALRSRTRPHNSPLNAPGRSTASTSPQEITVNGSWRFAAAVPEANGRLKDKVQINGAIETHLVGAYHYPVS